MTSVDLAALRRDVAAIGEAGNRVTGKPRSAFTFGFPDIDQTFGEGLQRGALHEVFPAETGDTGAATGFVIALALRASKGNGPILWLEEDFTAREHGGLYAPGLSIAGLDPQRLVIVRCPTPIEVLKGASDALEVGAVGAVVMAPWSNPRVLDLTATRRLLLGALQTDSPAFLLRVGGAPGESAAMTRWSVRAAPSLSRSTHAPGHPAFDVTLLRNRQGLTGHWFMEWNNDEHVFRQLKTVSGAVVSASAYGQAAPRKSTTGGR